MYQLSEEDAKKHAARRTKIDGGLAENGRHASLAGGGRMYSFRRGSMTDVGRERSGTDIAQDSDAFSDLNLGDHICWIGQGESFAEIALLNAHKPAPYSVMAGNSGVRVLTLERASYAHLLSQAKASPDVAVCIKALHGAMCLRPLRTSAGLRSEADVSLLTDILQTMDAFRNMPRDLCLNLAEGMVHVRAPAGTHNQKDCVCRRGHTSMGCTGFRPLGPPAWRLA